MNVVSQQASAGLEEVSLFVAERMSKTCWWKNFKQLLWLWYLLSRGCAQATVPPQTDTHGDSSSIPLIWETHIRVSCVMLLTNSRVTMCHLQHPETVSTYFLSYRRSFILFFFIFRQIRHQTELHVTFGEREQPVLFTAGFVNNTPRILDD